MPKAAGPLPWLSPTAGQPAPLPTTLYQRLGLLAPPSRELRSLQRSGCLRGDPFRVALFGGRGPFPGQLCPCGADRPLWGRCHWHRWRCHWCGGDRGGWNHRWRRNACPACPGHRGGDDGQSDARGCHDQAGWGCDALRSLNFLGSFDSALPFVVAFLLRLLTLMVGQGGDGPEADICGWRPRYVPPLVRQKAGNPVCAILPGHVGLPGSQVFVPGCTSSAGRVDLQVGVRVDHRELPDDLAAPPLAGWQYQALVECQNLSEVGLVRQPGVTSLHVCDHVLHGLQPVGPLPRRESLPPGHVVWEIGIRVHPLSTQTAEEAMALPLVEVGP
jgi:hypothetical protein